MSQNVPLVPLVPLRSRSLAVAASSALLLLLPCLLALFAPSSAQAQVQLEIKLTRRSYILYEPMIATVTITNLAGRDLLFEDAGPKQWFNIEVYGPGEQLIQPFDPDYKLKPLVVHAGESVKRQIDITPLFPIRDMGFNRVRANVYLAEMDKFFTSNVFGFDMTDGKLIWRQDVGVPGGGMRQLSLLTHHLPDRQLLYIRVRDEDHNVVYATQSLNRLLSSGREPEVLLDRANTIHVLHQAVPRTYLYTVMSLDGELLSQQVFSESTGTHTRLYKDPDTGKIEVRGGELQVNPTTGGAVGSLIAAPTGPKLSDRPTGLAVPKIPAKPKGDVITQ